MGDTPARERLPRPSNYRLNPPVGPVTALANGASAAPVPPAG